MMLRISADFAVLAGTLPCASASFR